MGGYSEFLPPQPALCPSESSFSEPHKPELDITDVKTKPPLKALSFSGCGGMVPYVLGVAKAIGEDFDLSSCTFSGASGGTAPAAMLAAEGDIEEFFEKCVLPGTEELGTRWHGAFGNGLEIVSKWMKQYFPKDMYRRVNSRVTFVVTSVFPRPCVISHSHFEDTEDMANCMRASCMIPGLLSLCPGSWYRGALCLDGGFGHNQPVLPGLSHVTVRIYPSKFRAMSPLWILPFADAAWNRHLFWTGYWDGKTNAKKIELEGKGLVFDAGWCQYQMVSMSILYELFGFCIRCVIKLIVVFTRMS